MRSTRGTDAIDETRIADTNSSRSRDGRLDQAKGPSIAPEHLRLRTGNTDPGRSSQAVPVRGRTDGARLLLCRRISEIPFGSAPSGLGYRGRFDWRAPCRPPNAGRTVSHPSDLSPLQRPDPDRL